MRRAGRALAEVHRELAKAVAPGVQIKDLDTLADRLIRERGGIPSSPTSGCSRRATSSPWTWG
jgi:methionyl aminopeptidase